MNSSTRFMLVCALAGSLTLPGAEIASDTTAETPAAPVAAPKFSTAAEARVRAIEKRCFLAAAAVSLASAAVIALFPEGIARLFLSGATAADLELCVGALGLFCLTYLTRWLSFATQSYMLAIGRALPAVLISVSTALVFPVLLIGALWPLGLTGIWLNFAGTAALAGGLALTILARTRALVRRPDGAGTEP